MGWAIRSSDGTYRAWNANTQDDALRPGEVWVSLDAPPLLAPPSPNPLKVLIQAALADLSVPGSIKAILTVWRAQL